MTWRAVRCESSKTLSRSSRFCAVTATPAQARSKTKLLLAVADLVLGSGRTPKSFRKPFAAWLSSQIAGKVTR